MAAPKKTPVKASSKDSKETIYVGVDDEITHIIDKVNASSHKIIALVLPRRAAVLQSVVNMKLLKKSATSNKKNIVLITSEQGLYPLAGAAGIHVAKSLQSKPAIPPSPMADKNDNEIDEVTADDESPLDKNAAIGALAAAAAAPDHDDSTETIEFDNSQTSKTETALNKVKKNKRLKVPNFERFRLGFVLAGLAVVLLVVGWFMAFIVMPKATITIRTDTTSVVSSFDFTASVDQPELDVNDRKIPAVLRESKKIESEKGTATGERDDGTKASGEVTLSVACGPGAAVTVQSGTAVSSGDLNYITQKKASLTTADFSGGSCRLTDTVKVVAAENGDKYNIASDKTFNVAGHSNVTGRNEDAMTGGTSKIVKIVSQKDMDDALSRLASRQSSAVTDELSASLESEGLFALKETLVTGEPKVNIEPEVGKEATEFTVSTETQYSMLGVKEDELARIIEDDVKDEIDLDKQSITDNGIQNAIMRINNHTKPGQAFISFRTSVTAGPEIDEQAVKEYARGKKLGEVTKYIEAIPGVQEADVRYSPFWVYSTPKAAKKITVVTEKLNEQNQAGNANGNE